MPRYSFPDLAGRVVAVDFEATGVQWWKDEVYGVGIAFREGFEVRKMYFDLRYPEARAWMETALLEAKLWVNQYIKYDVHMAREGGFRHRRERISCTMIREALIDENKYEYGLDTLGMKYLNRTKEEPWGVLATMFGGAATKDVQIRNMVNAPEGIVAPYAATDAELALLVWEAQEKVIDQEGLRRVYDLEMRLLRVLIDCEHRGVRVDLDRAQQAHRQLNKQVWEIQKRLDRAVGRPVNANSPDQTKAILGVHRAADGYWYTGDNLRLESNDPTKAQIKAALAAGEPPPRQGSAKLDSIKMQQCKIPEAQMIVDIRGLMKARDTMIEQYMLNMNVGGYVHANFNQTRTEDGNGIYTGRISISEPALQQIHKRNKVMAAIVRACFVPDNEYGGEPEDEWWCFDWSQKDFRVFAHFLNDIRINAEYSRDPNMDFHKLVANITGLPRDRDQKTGGANAKQINLACVFGMGAGELAKQCNLPYTVSTKGYLIAGPEAKAMFGKYHSNIPGVRKLQNSVESVAKSRGHIVTQLGRRIRFPHGHGAHKAAGLLYQATAADAMKLKACELFELFEAQPDYTGRLLCLVHDEFDNSVRPWARDTSFAADVKALLERFDGTQTPMQYRVPILADFGFGNSWWEASK